MEIKKVIEKRCGISLPISGGIANSIKNATAIEPVENYIEVENQFIGCMLGNKWEKYEQKLILEDNVYFIDHLSIKYTTDNKLIIYLDFFFNISMCI
ncbi:MAG: hypothetical protein ACOYLP_02430 [Flavobacterium sp.]|uniref:hypothetical protein n=1 Tax=Flavobacterium sp. TaxID=239 RepID=UPI003BBFE50B